MITSHHELHLQELVHLEYDLAIDKA